MSARPSKTALKAELLERLSADLETLARAQAAAQQAATHEEAKAEDDKDTRAIEQSYLARGQAMRVEDLKVAVAEVSAMVIRDFAEDAPVALGALVSAIEDDATLVFFLAPHGGGLRLANGGVQVITPRSPLGRALLGKREGDDCEVTLAGKARALTIEGVRVIARTGSGPRPVRAGGLAPPLTRKDLPNHPAREVGMPISKRSASGAPQFPPRSMNSSIDCPASGRRSAVQNAQPAIHARAIGIGRTRTKSASPMSRRPMNGISARPVSAEMPTTAKNGSHCAFTESASAP
jgi:transcription elongation GreA/GreB family factor